MAPQDHVNLARLSLRLCDRVIRHRHRPHSYLIPRSQNLDISLSAAFTINVILAVAFSLASVVSYDHK
jgi:hypothetical protein